MQTLPTSPTAPSTVASATRPIGSSGSVPSARGGNRRWPLIGLVAAGTGMGAAILSISAVSDEDTVATGMDVLDQLDRGRYHLSFVLGLVSVVALHLVASGWRRWADQRAPGSIAARTIGTGLTATATVNTIFTCLAGSMALYLPGGTDAGWLSREGMFVNYSLLDFGPLLGWWGAMVSAACVAYVALRERLLARWLGIVSIVLVVLPLVPVLATGLPGIVGLAMPIWLLIASVGLSASRRAA